MRKLNLLIFVSLVFSILFVSPIQAQTIFKMAFVAPPPVWGPVAEKYGQIVAQKTNNQFQIKWFGGGQLGSLPQIIAGIKTGQIDMILCDLASLFYHGFGEAKVAFEQRIHSLFEHGNREGAHSLHFSKKIFVGFLAEQKDVFCDFRGVVCCSLH